MQENLRSHMIDAVCRASGQTHDQSAVQSTIERLENLVGIELSPFEVFLVLNAVESNILCVSCHHSPPLRCYIDQSCKYCSGSEFKFSMEADVLVENMRAFLADHKPEVSDDDEDAVTFYSKHFGMFMGDFTNHGCHSLKIEIEDRDNVQSGYWVTIEWYDRDDKYYQVDAQWRRLAWERAFAKFNKITRELATNCLHCGAGIIKPNEYCSEMCREAGPKQ